MIVLKHFWSFLWRVLCAFIARMHVIGRLVTALGSARYSVIGLARHSLIRCWIDDLGEVSLSSDFRRCRALLRRLRIDLLLLHRVILRAIVDW